MEIRLLDEVIDLGERGVALLCVEGGEALRPGMLLRDARGRVHALAAVTLQDGVYLLHVPQGDASAFERLFRDIFVDATRFTVEEAPPCP